MPNLLFAGLDAFAAKNLSRGISEFVADRNPVYDGITRHLSDIETWLSSHWADLQAWLISPEIWPVILAWWITFTIVVTLFLTLGFGPAGVVAGSLAAGFQAWAYGAFTPAGGLFATFTSLAMVGMLMPVVAVIAAVIASLVAFVVHLSL